MPNNHAISGVYAIVNTPTGKLYIGSSVNILSRKSHHFASLADNTHHNRYLQRAFNKYGRIAVKFYVCEIVECQDILIAREQAYIDLHDSANPEFGYNVCPIADSSLGYKATSQQKHNNSVAQQGKKLSEAHKRKISESRMGHVHKQETKNKMKASYQYSEKRRTATIEANKHRIWTQEQRDKQRIKNTGSNHPFWNKKHTIETKLKMSRSAKERWRREKDEFNRLQLLLF